MKTKRLPHPDKIVVLNEGKLAETAEECRNEGDAEQRVLVLLDDHPGATFAIVREGRIAKVLNRTVLNKLHLIVACGRTAAVDELQRLTDQGLPWNEAVNVLFTTYSTSTP